jgi:hypothetical protein
MEIVVHKKKKSVPLGTTKMFFGISVLVHIGCRLQISVFPLFYYSNVNVKLLLHYHHVLVFNECILHLFP